MKLLIKQRVFSWADTYDVFDEEGNAKYFVKAEFFSIGHVLHIYDKETGAEVGMIREKVLSWTPKFFLEVDGNVVGTICKKLTLFRPKYEIDCNGWQVEGDFWEWNYEVKSGERTILRISKELLHWGDTYVIDFENPEDEWMGLLLVIAIDAANCANSGA